MSNCRLKYAKDIADNIIKESNLDNTSAIKLKENVNQYLLPIGGKNGKNEKLQTIKNTYEWAKSIQDWANNHYDSKRLGNTVYINDDPQGRGTIVTIMMPKLLIDAYENKFGQMSNEDFNSLLDKKEYYDALDKAAVEDSIKNDKQDTHLREKYFAKNDESPASRILRRISKTSHPLAKLAEKLESYVSINDVTIKLVPKIKYTDESAVNNSAGVYYHNTNSIEIAEYANFPAALAESVLIHEIIHALTVKQLRSNSTVNKDFTELYEYVKTKLPAYNKANNTGTYATTSLDEFMVGIFTDSNFIKQLKDIPPFKGKNKYKNFFEEVFNTILNALGIKTTDNVYEEAFSIASNIIEDARESSLANELYNQSSLGIENEFNSNQPETTVSKKNTKLEQALKEFAKINGIKIEFVDSLVEQFGGDYTAAYDAVNKIVYINEGKAGIDTLSEEIAHSLTLALGEDHFLVKKAFNLLSRTDYKSTLDPKYVALYKNNETALKHEVIGKMIAKVLVKQYEPKTEAEFKLFGAIMQLIDKFISLFKRNDRLEDTIKDLASKITNKEVVAFDEVSKENSVYFQVDTTKVKSKVEDIKEQFVYLKQQLKKNIDKLSSLDKDDPDFPILRDKIKKNKAALEELEATGNKQIVIDLGNELLDNLEIMLNNVEDPDIELKLDNKTINAAETTFSKLAKVPALAQRAMSLEQRLQPIVQEYMVKEINDRATEGREITEEEIFGRTSDVSKLTGWFGKLSNSPNYIARTIHQMIKEVQSKVSAKNKENLHSIKEEVEALRQWSKDNGISEEDMYDIFIQEHKNTTVLTRRFTPEFYKEIDAAFKLPKSERYEALSKIGKYESSLNMWIPKNKKYINENYTKIQNTPALKRFYDFHTSLVTEAASKLPVKINPEFIANISSNSLKDALKSDETTKSKQLLEMASNLTGINIKQFQDGTFVADEGLFQDLIPLKFIASMDASKKSKNLGDNLAKFVNFANNYEEMSEILPTIRSMQNQLGKQSFTKSSDPTIAIKGVETNIYKFIDTVIDMQVKGNMKKDELKIKIGTLTDDEGNPIGEKYIHGSKVADFVLKYNSLLRIGFNPFNAITNILVGDIGNIIEAFGGRFYTLTNLKDASNIFFKDALNEDSDLNHWRDKIGPLQELEDYETVEQVSTGKGINKEKVENFMYMPQKLGETWLQNRTMVAILLKDGYMDSDGKTTEKGKNITETELKRLINKCYEVNNKIHGRYSSRDAAAISQQVLPRMMMQFKKWIPAAIESRFESKHFNVDLGVEVEGRYKTGWRLLRKALQGDLKALQAGNMTELELYNMKKNLAEIVIALAATLSFIAMGAFGDDDEELKKNPYYKFTMDQLDRLSGDLLYFYNPGSYTETVLKPIALAKTTSDVINCVVAFPHIFGLQGKKDVYQSGSRKGENKFIAKAVDVTPIIAPIAKVARNYKKDVKYQSYK